MASALTEKSPSRLTNLKPLWHRSAPRRLAEKCPSNNPALGWTAWQNHLARRTLPVPPPFLVGKDPALAWGLAGGREAGLLTQMLAAPADYGAELIASPQGGEPDLAAALQTVALAYCLPGLTDHLPADSWWRLAELLHEIAADAEQPSIDPPDEPARVVVHQLLAGELPLALGYLFPELAQVRALRKPARAALSEALVELTDGEGMLHGQLLGSLGSLLACWTRVRWIGERLDRGCWSRMAEIQYQWLVRQAIRLANRDGTFAFSAGHCRTHLAGGGTPSVSTWSPGLFSAALAMVGDSGDAAAAEARLPRKVSLPKVKFGAGDLPPAPLESEWACAAVLAQDWSANGPRVAVSFATDPLHLELTAGGATLLAGGWTSTTFCDGEVVRVVGQWEEICWQSDKNCDYLELTVTLSHQLRLERQLLLARDEPVLFLADVVVAADGKARQIEHAMHLPLGRAAAWQGEAETRDGLLVGGKSRAAVLPLALQEWRCDPRGGSLEERGGRLSLQQAGRGRALYCPLLVDLKPKRIKKERTWRQLTVAEALEIVAPDVAIGFRAQSGSDQWLVYRSLAPAGNRTVLGQNISGEFCGGRFHTTGKLKEWIEVEVC